MARPQIQMVRVHGLRLAWCVPLVGQLHLKLAMLVEPAREWRIITSDEHSTVWDGRDTLFEFHWQAFGEPPETCFHAAYDEELHPGELMEVSFAGHYSERDT